MTHMMEVVGLGWGFFMVYFLVQSPVCVLASWEEGTIEEVVVFFLCRIAKVSKFKIVTVSSKLLLAA